MSVNLLWIEYYIIYIYWLNNNSHIHVYVCTSNEGYLCNIAYKTSRQKSEWSLNFRLGYRLETRLCRYYCPGMLTNIFITCIYYLR